MSKPNVVPITAHTDYVPERVRAYTFYLVDPRLDNLSRDVYRFILGKAEERMGVVFSRYNGRNELIDALMAHFSNDKSETALTEAFAKVKRAGYVRFNDNPMVGSRILQIFPWVGNKVRY